MSIHDPSLRAALKILKLTGMLDTSVPCRPYRTPEPSAERYPHR